MCPVCKVPFVHNSIDGYGLLTSPLHFLDALVHECTNTGCSQAFQSATARDMHSGANCMFHVDDHGESVATRFNRPSRAKLGAHKVNTTTHTFIYNNPAIKEYTFEFLNDALFARATVTLNISSNVLVCHATSTESQATVEFGDFSATLFLHPAESHKFEIGQLVLMDTVSISIVPLYSPDTISDCATRFQYMGKPHTPIPQGPFISTRFSQRQALIAAAGTSAENIALLRVPVEKTPEHEILLCVYDDREFTYERLAICPSCFRPFRVSALFEHIAMSREYIEQHAHVVDRYDDERKEWFYRGSAVSPCANLLAGGDVVYMLRSRATREYQNKFPMSKQLAYFLESAPPVYYGFFLTMADAEKLVAISYTETNSAQCCVCAITSTADTVDPSEILAHLGLAGADVSRMRRLLLTPDRKEVIVSNELFETFASMMDTEFQ